MRRIAPGMRVLTPFHSGCGACRYCVAGASNLCDAPGRRTGGFAQYAVIGTYDEYWGGKALGLAAQPAVIRDFNLVSALTAVPLLTLLGLIIWRNRRASRIAAAL